MISTRLAALGVSAVLLSAGAGCVQGNYRVVKTVPNAGEVALEGPQEEARQKAEGYMASRCASGYDIVEEGETVIGQNATLQSRNTTGIFLGPGTRTQTSTTDKREWRIKYQCKGTAAAPTHGRVEEVIVRF